MIRQLNLDVDSLTITANALEEHHELLSAQQKELDKLRPLKTQLLNVLTMIDFLGLKGPEELEEKVERTLKAANDSLK